MISIQLFESIAIKLKKYKSTRGIGTEIVFQDVVLSGTAEDGGLYVPTQEAIDLSSINSTDYEALVRDIFIALDKNSEELVKSNSLYKGFKKEPSPNLIELEEGMYLMELFHGPTGSFKDYALQVLGSLADQQLNNIGKKGIALVATSGDTGSAAIQGVKDSNNVDIVVLHPYNKISKYQRKQMTTVDSPNVRNFAVKGDYDDCQKLVKNLLSSDITGRQVISLNSINWIRVVAQSSYYVWLSKQIEGSFDVVIPSGNFGNAYSAWFAKKNGIPIGNIICSTNNNDVLTRFIKKGKLEPLKTVGTLAPSMDIQLPSSLERLIHDLLEDSSLTKAFYEELSTNGSVSLPRAITKKLHNTFQSDSFNDEEIKSSMKKISDLYSYTADPHTATSIALAKNLKSNNPIVALGTASPIKFQGVVNEVFNLNEESTIDLEESFVIIDDSIKKLKEKIF